MIPGFITLYLGKDNLPHLYFFKGYTDDGKFYYNALNLHNCKYEYDDIKYPDGAIEYIFKNDNIKRIKCKLVNYKGEEDYQVLEIK